MIQVYLEKDAKMETKRHKDCRTEITRLKALR